MLAWFNDMGLGIMGALDPLIFLSALLGVSVGAVIGIIPGLGPAVVISLAIPLTFGMGPLFAIALFLGIYKGGTYGGSISAILINTPGTPAAAATILDGYPLAKQGKAGKALTTALYASVFGDAFGIMMLCVVAQPIARLALRFGPTELFSLLIFALTMIAALSGRSIAKGIIAALSGILLSSVGTDPMTSDVRYCFGLFQLEDGVAIIPMVIGLFAVSELLAQVERVHAGTEAALLPPPACPDDNRMNWREFRHCLPIFLRSSCIGVGIGALPGTGSTTAAFLSYGTTQRTSKRQDLFGKGSVEGLAAAESGNNAVCGGALVPMLTLGIPGDDITAILLGAMTIHGVNVGPLIFEEHRAFVYTLFGTLFISVFMLLLIGRFLIPLCRRFAHFPQGAIMPVVLLLCVIGSYGVQFSTFDCWVMLAFGLVGYVMGKAELPAPPMLIAFIVAPQLEFSFRQAMMLSRGQATVFFTHPISLGFLLLAAASLVQVARMLRKRKALEAARSAPDEAEESA